MKKEDIKTGEIYYTTLASEESVSYGDNQPRRPYQAKARVDERGLIHLHQFNQETGEIDTDSNATAFVTCAELQVFETEAEAMVAYQKQLISHQNKLIDELSDINNELADVTEFITKGTPLPPRLQS